MEDVVVFVLAIKIVLESKFEWNVLHNLCVLNAQSTSSAVQLIFSLFSLSFSIPISLANVLFSSIPISLNFHKRRNSRAQYPLPRPLKLPNCINHIMWCVKQRDDQFPKIARKKFFPLCAKIGGWHWHRLDMSRSLRSWTPVPVCPCRYYGRQGKWHWLWVRN